MMREIKFRGKTEWGTWCYGGYTKINDEKSDIWEYSASEIPTCPSVTPCTVLADTVGQYTGLRDSTEQEVYEGDILSDARGRLYVIVWRAGGPCVYSADEYRDMRRKVPVTLHDALADRQVSNYVQEGLTVVGNIHDAPEMLK